MILSRKNLQNNISAKNGVTKIMKKICIFMTLVILSMISGIVFATPKQLEIQYDDKYPSPTAPSSKVLPGAIRQDQELPQEMYGMWQVKGTLLETNDYERYLRSSSDVWVLRKEGNYVTLMNPQNGASATITVTEVKNNTATFTRSEKSRNSVGGEKVTLTLADDKNHFTGIDVIVSEAYQYGVPIKSFAKYKLDGSKISNQTIVQKEKTKSKAR